MTAAVARGLGVAVGLGSAVGGATGGFVGVGALAVIVANTWEIMDASVARKFEGGWIVGRTVGGVGAGVPGPQATSKMRLTHTSKNIGCFTFAS